MKRIVGLILVFACLFVFADERPVSPYGIGAVRLDRAKDEVVLSLACAKGFHLNGDGYPPIVILITIPGERVDLSCEGVTENERHEWLIRVPLGTDEMMVAIEAIACGNSRCVPISDTLSIRIEDSVRSGGSQ